MYSCSMVVESASLSRQTKTFALDSCLAAGYTGRDQASVRQHVNELQQLGVAAPYAIPACYWISPSRISQASEIHVVGEQTSPEVEFFLARDESGELCCTVASDHTDRKLEAVSVSKAKQICDKILGDHLWRVADVTNHWQQLELRSRVFHQDQWRDYQSGSLAEILHYEELLQLAAADRPEAKAAAIFSGTLPVAGGETLYASACEIILSDPILNRTITKRYQVSPLPDRS